MSPPRSLQDSQVSCKIFSPGLHQTRENRVSACILLGRPATPGLLSLFLELCYGNFTKDFPSALKKLSESYDKQDAHITKIYKDTKLLTEICTKLEVSCSLLLGDPETPFACIRAWSPVRQRSLSEHYLPHPRWGRGSSLTVILWDHLKVKRNLLVDGVLEMGSRKLYRVEGGQFKGTSGGLNLCPTRGPCGTDLRQVK